MGTKINESEVHTASIHYVPKGPAGVVTQMVMAVRWNELPRGRLRVHFVIDHFLTSQSRVLYFIPAGRKTVPALLSVSRFADALRAELGAPGRLSAEDYAHVATGSPIGYRLLSLIGLVLAGVMGRLMAKGTASAELFAFGAILLFAWHWRLWTGAETRFRLSREDGRSAAARTDPVPVAAPTRGKYKPPRTRYRLNFERRQL